MRALELSVLLVVLARPRHSELCDGHVHQCAHGLVKFVEKVRHKV